MNFPLFLSKLVILTLFSIVYKSNIFDSKTFNNKILQAQTLESNNLIAQCTFERTEGLFFNKNTFTYEVEIGERFAAITRTDKYGRINFIPLFRTSKKFKSYEDENPPLNKDLYEVEFGETIRPWKIRVTKYKIQNIRRESKIYNSRPKLRNLKLFIDGCS